MVAGCSAPQPDSSLHALTDWQAAITSASLRSGRRFRCALTTFSSSSSARSREHWMQTHRSTLTMFFRNPMWYTGRQSSMCPK